MEIPQIICPLCREKNKAFESQRCAHCKMLMMSDTKYAEQNQIIKPLMEKIMGDFKFQGKSTQIQPILDQLALYKDDHIIVQEFLQGVSKKIQPLFLVQRLEMMWKLNIFIAVVLFLLPIGTALTQMPMMITGLLALPAIAWLWIGIIIFRKKMNQQISALKEDP